MLESPARTHAGTVPRRERLGGPDLHPEVACEADSTGYALHRQRTAMGIACVGQRVREQDQQGEPWQADPDIAQAVQHDGAFDELPQDECREPLLDREEPRTAAAPATT